MHTSFLVSDISFTPPSIVVKCGGVVLHLVVCGVVFDVSCVVLFLICVCVCDLFLIHTCVHSQVRSRLATRRHAASLELPQGCAIIIYRG